jgi:ribosomal protein S27AE
LKKKKYREIKSRNSVTKDFGRRVEVRTKPPKNTCHPGATIQFHSLDKPPKWTCGKCGGVLLVETPVNTAEITEME